MNKAKYLLLLSIYLFSTKSYCQSTLIEEYPMGTDITHNNNIPFSNSIAKTSNIISFTGNADISIPIYTIECDGIKIPITLNYNPNDLKVNEKASWVGFGWSLSYGGEVSRKMNSYPDDYIYKSTMDMATQVKYGYALGGAENIDEFNPSSNTPYQGYAGALLSAFNGLPQQPEISTTNFGSASVPNILRNNYKSSDTEPDLFYYSSPTTNGGFAFHKNSSNADMKIGLIPFNKNKIGYELGTSITLPNNTTPQYRFDKFIIDDEQGNRFIYGNPDLSYLSYAPYIGNITENDEAATIGMDVNATFREYLSHIYYPKWNPTTFFTKNQKQINFSYTQENFDDYQTSLQSKYYYFNHLQTCPTCDPSHIGLGCDITRYHSYGHTNRLTSIETDKEKIVFLSYSNRLDAVGSKQLDEIQIYKRENNDWQLIKKIILHYDYFNSGNNDHIFPAFLNSGLTNIFETYDYTYFNNTVGDPHKRLKLINMKEVSPNGDEMPHFYFTYDESLPFPIRFSKQQDLFGYFNNAISNKHSFPKLFVYPDKNLCDRITPFRRNDWVNSGVTEYQLDGADRNTSSTAITTGTLKKITYPTGGSTTYTFEPNSFNWGGENRLGGGLRIKKIERTDQYTNNSNVTEYSYTDVDNSNISSGVLLGFPYYAKMENTPQFPTSDGNYGSLIYPSQYAIQTIDRHSQSYFEQYITRFNEPTYSMGFDNILLGYKTITATNNVSGYVVTSYLVPSLLNQEDPDPLLETSINGISNIPLYKIQSTNALLGVSYKIGSPRLYPYRVLPILPWAGNNVDILSGTNQGTPDMVGMGVNKFSFYAGPRTNFDWARGQISKITTYDNNGATTNEKIFSYKIQMNNSVPTEFYGIKTNSAFFYDVYGYKYNTPLEYSWAKRGNWIYSQYKQIGDVSIVPTTVVEKNFFSGDVVQNTVNITYLNNPSDDNYPRTISTGTSNGDTKVTKLSYPTDILTNTVKNNITAGVPASSQVLAIKRLVDRNILTEPIEITESIIKAGTNTPMVIGATCKDYFVPYITATQNNQLYPSRLNNIWTISHHDANPYFQYANISFDVNNNTYVFNKSSVYDNPLNLKKVFKNYDKYGHILDMESNTRKEAFLYSQTNKDYATAKVMNAENREIAFTSFEDFSDVSTSGNIGNWFSNSPYYSWRIYTDHAFTGNQSYRITAPIATIDPQTGLHSLENGLTVGKEYVVSFWSKCANITVTDGINLISTPSCGNTSDGWFYHEGVFTAQQHVSDAIGFTHIDISGSTYLGCSYPIPSSNPNPNPNPFGLIDELRLYPKAAQMESYTFTPLQGITSADDKTGHVVFYEYDDFGRVIYIRDENKNIIKRMEYGVQTAE